MKILLKTTKLWATWKQLSLYNFHSYDMYTMPHNITWRKLVLFSKTDLSKSQWYISFYVYKIVWLLISNFFCLVVAPYLPFALSSFTNKKLFFCPFPNKFRLHITSALFQPICHDISFHKRRIFYLKNNNIN